MSKKSKKVVDTNKINELLNQKGKDMLGEAFEGMGGVVTMKPIHNMEGSFSQPTQVNEENFAANKNLDWKHHAQNKYLAHPHTKSVAHYKPVQVFHRYQLREIPI